jgi:hypothetical protein
MPKKPQNPVDKYVGNRVRMRRLMLRMSQTEFSEGLGLTFWQVQKYEKGTSRLAQAGCNRYRASSRRSSSTVHRPNSRCRRRPLRRRSPAYVQKFLASKEGLAICEAFSADHSRLKDRRRREFL